MSYNNILLSFKKPLLLASLSVLSFSTFANDAQILNLANLQKSNNLPKQIGLYQSYTKINTFIKDHQELDPQNLLELQTMLNSIRNYVLYPVVLAKAISAYPDDFSISNYGNYFTTYFPEASFTQNMFNKVWQKDLEVEHFDNVYKYESKFTHDLNNSCLIESTNLLSYKHLNLGRAEHLYNTLMGYKTISEECKTFVSTYINKLKLSKANIEASDKFMASQVENNNQKNLDIFQDISRHNKHLGYVYNYASNILKDASYVFQQKVNTGIYLDLNQTAIYRYIKANRYKDEQSLTDFFALVNNSKLDNTNKKYAFAKYFEYNYYRIPSEVTDQYVTLFPTDRTLENKVREAILGKKPYLHLIKKMSADNRKDTEWQYWYAKAIEKSNRKEAYRIYANLSNSQGFYGLVASKKLNRPYRFVHNNVRHIDSPYNFAKNLPWYYAAIKEANDNGDTVLAKKLWYDIKVNKEYTGLISWAYQNEFYFLGVSSSIRQGLKENLRARFPDAYAKSFVLNSQHRTVSKTFAQAIARQESAWNYTAVSRAPAYGLMQFINSTAKRTAKQIGISYNGPKDLFNPSVAITLGTYHLSELLDENDNNRALTAIGYNAGPRRISQWLERSNGRLDFDEFVATIPFTETRNYVMNTLTFDYYNQVIQGVKHPVTIYNNEWNRKY